jgi:hypothetical protein
MEERAELETAVPVRPVRQKQDRTTMALLFVASLVAVGGIGFAAGHLTAPAAAANPTFARGGGFARNGGGAFPTLAPGQTFNPGDLSGGGTRGLVGLNGGISGTVQSVDGSTMTIQTANGQTVTVQITGSTTYHSETPADSSQVKVGSSVTVQIDAGALASESPAPSGSGGLGGRQIPATDVLITNP